VDKSNRFLPITLFYGVSHEIVMFIFCISRKMFIT